MIGYGVRWGVVRMLDGEESVLWGANASAHGAIVVSERKSQRGAVLVESLERVNA